MPKCLECCMLSDNRCSAYEKAKRILDRPFPPYPLGACVLPIVEDYLKFIKKDMSVLEIGCGSWEIIKNRCEEVGAGYEAIDVQREYYGKRSVATRFENLSNLSFSSERFDIVFGNQTMEHWSLNGCALEWGLFQCFRVCKTGGRVFMNVPIHFHGSWQFMLGKNDVIRNLFSRFSTNVSFNVWGYPSQPVPPVYPFSGYWKLNRKPAYILDIAAIKDIPLPRNCNNLFAAGGKLAELFNYPFSYNLYRLLHKVGFFAENIGRNRNYKNV